MVRVALYLEGLTLGKSWLLGPEVLRPRFSAFEFEEPEHGLWRVGSTVDDLRAPVARSQGTVDLVMKSHNDIGEDAVSKVVRHWKQKVA
ncbi:hypothetical protein AHAS_Ahas04G0103500 [Arachis hypogaea]